MNLSNIKNAMYRGYTYTSTNSAYYYVGLSIDDGYIMVIINDKVIVEFLGKEIISIKNLDRDNDFTYYKFDNDEKFYFNNKIKMHINYFSPISVSIDEDKRVAGSTPSESITIPKGTIFFNNGISANNIEIENINIGSLITKVDDPNNINTDTIKFGNWNIIKGVDSENENSVISITYNK